MVSLTYEEQLLIYILLYLNNYCNIFEKKTNFVFNLYSTIFK